MADKLVALMEIVVIMIVKVEFVQQFKLNHVLKIVTVKKVFVVTVFAHHVVSQALFVLEIHNVVQVMVV